MSSLKNLTIIFVILLSLAPRSILAKGNGASAAIMTLQAPSARASSMGESISADADDIASFAFNPASLDSLTMSQASFMYQKGLADDSYSALSLGLRQPKGTWGVSISHYDGGDVMAYDGTNSRLVTAKRDLSLGIGYARTLKTFSTGITGRYLSSEVADTASAKAVAVDLGLAKEIHPHVRLGLAIQNIGTEMRYDQESYSLPAVIRMGVSTNLMRHFYPVSFHYDIPYYITEKRFYPGMGVEYKYQLLAFRAGYSNRQDLGGLTFGTGFAWRNMSIDYSFNLINDANSRHFFSFTTRFGATPLSAMFTEAPKSEVSFSSEKPFITVYELTNAQDPNHYVIQPGDTLESIAYKVYGNRQLWTKIFYANTKTLKTSSLKDKAGVRIIIP